MKVIADYVEHLDEEIEGAKEYAEKYVEAKARGKIDVANKYKEMAHDELRHATYVHGFAVAEIEAISKVFTPPADMQEKWNKAHKEYVERVAWVKQMLEM